MDDYVFYIIDIVILKKKYYLQDKIQVIIVNLVFSICYLVLEILISFIFFFFQRGYCFDWIGGDGLEFDFEYE